MSTRKLKEESSVGGHRRRNDLAKRWDHGARRFEEGSLESKSMREHSRTSRQAPEREMSINHRTGEWELNDADQRQSAMRIRPRWSTNAEAETILADVLHDMPMRSEMDKMSGAKSNDYQSQVHSQVPFDRKTMDLLRKAKHEGNDIMSNYDFKVAHKMWRWNLVWLVMALLAPYPLWLTFPRCKTAYEITIIINVIITLNYSVATVLCFQYLWRMIRSFQYDWRAGCDQIDPELSKKIVHIVVLPTYKEPVSLLIQTISSIAKQSIAHQIVVCVGMEEKTPEQEEKKRAMRDAFELEDGSAVFQGLIFAVHPFGMAGEISGACSNRNHASRESVKHCIRAGLIPQDPKTGELDLSHHLLTVCDADTTFHPRYFECLTHCFMTQSETRRFEVCYQSPLFYNIDLAGRYFFTRIIGILRSYFMVGFLIAMNINTMSIYSMSVQLLIESHFFHPGYQMDDIIYTLSAMKTIRKRVEIISIDVPTLSGPTSGATMVSEWDEWVTQAMRWTIGAAEVFHYFVVKLVGRKMDMVSGLGYFWWFTYYYGVVLCVGGMVTLCNLIMTIVAQGYPNVGPAHDSCMPMSNWFGAGFTDWLQEGELDANGSYDNSVWFYNWVFGFFLLFFYIAVVLVAFIMDAVVSQVMALDEKVGPLRQLFHFLMAQPVLWAYCLVEFRAICVIAYYGKAVCGHKPSEKGNLKTDTAAAKKPVKASEVAIEPVSAA